MADTTAPKGDAPTDPMAIHYIDDRHWSGLCTARTGDLASFDTSEVTCRDCLILLDAPDASL